MLPALERVLGSDTSSWHFNIRQEPSFPFDWHYHEEFELTLIVAGSGRRCVGDSVQRYEAGDLVLIGSNVPHTWRSEQDGPHRAMTCQFLPGFLGSSLTTAPEFKPVGQMLQRSTLGLRFGAEEAFARRRIEAMATLDAPRRTIELLGVLVDLAALSPEVLSTRTLLPQALSTDRRRIEDVLGYVDREYGNEVTLERAAVAAGMTPRSLSRFFRDRTSRTFTDYVNDVRCAAASRLLMETELPVARIAAECGYANLSNFNRRFQERLTMTPRAYRNAFADTRASHAGTRP